MNQKTNRLTELIEYMTKPDLDIEELKCKKSLAYYNLNVLSLILVPVTIIMAILLTNTYPDWLTLLLVDLTFILAGIWVIMEVKIQQTLLVAARKLNKQKPYDFKYFNYLYSYFPFALSDLGGLSKNKKVAYSLIALLVLAALIFNQQLSNIPVTLVFAISVLFVINISIQEIFLVRKHKYFNK